MRGNAEILTGAIAVGIESLVHYVTTLPGLLKEHIGGFSKLGPRHKRFLAVCMMAGRPVDCALMKLMKDNRLLKMADKPSAAMQEEIGYVETRSATFWKRLAGLCQDGTTGLSLQSSCIRASHVTAVFV